MDLMDEELRRVLAGTAEPTRRREEAPATAAELAAASRPSFRMSSPGRRTQRGGGEALETIGSAVLGSIPAGLAGLGYLGAGQGPEKAAEAVQRVQDYLTIDPKTEGGIRAVRGIAEGLSPLGAIPQAAGEATLRATGSPLLATGAELMADPLNLLGAGAAARPAARAAAAAGRGAAKAGKATVQSLGPKAAEMAEAYMRRAGMTPEITVYHGSPHVFAPEEGAPLGRFRSEKIGTGEGHQAYGVGTYTAEAPEVATGYRERLTGKNPNVFLLGGKDVSIVGGSPEWKKFSDAAKSQGYSQESAALAYQALKEKKGDLDAASGELTWMDDATKIHDEAASLLRAMQYKPEGGALYAVDLPDPIVEKMLDWDKPLGQQSQDIQKAAQRIAANLDPEARKLIGDSLMNLKGSKLYELLASDDSVAGAGQFGAAASAIMREHGIPGIKYLDEGSRAAGKGTRNFVVFPGEEKSLTILQRNEQRLPQTDTPAFKEFTGGAPLIKADQASKAEFQTGKPVVIEGYHGTRRDFTAVDPAQASSGYFASSKPLVADEYAGVYPEGMGGGSFPTGGNVQKTYMRMDNPLVVNARGASFNRVDTRGIPGFGLPMSNTDMINHWAKQQGYDGVIYKDLRDSVARPRGQNTPASNVYVAFKPNYVKSAIGNRGTFDVGTTDMTKAQGGAVGGNMSYTQAADVIAGKLVGQGVDPDRAMTMALRMSDAHMKAGGAVLMSGGGSAPERPGRMRKTWDGPLPNRPVVNKRAMVSAEELADFRRQFGAQMTLRDLLNADKGRGPSAANPAARGVQEANIAPRGARVRPDEAATLPAAGAADIPGLIMQGMEQGAERVPAGRGAGAAFVGAGLPRAMTGSKLLREHPSISPERRQMLKEMEDYINGLNKERIEPTFAAGGAAKAGKAMSSALQAARAEARAAQTAQRAAEQAQRLSEMSPMQRNAHEVSKALAEQKTPITVKPDTVQRMMEERAAQIMQANPKLTEEAVAARARRDATRQLKWERQGRERLQKRYGELSPSRYDMPAQRKLRNLPGAVEERAEKAQEFLSRPTPPWEPPNAELQAFDRNLIKDALEGFPGIEQTRFPRYEAPRAQTGYIDEIYDDPRNRELIKQQIKRGLPLGGETFYASLYPVKVAAMERGIPAEKFDRFIYETAPASARNSIMNEMAVGQFMRDMKARGLPLDEQTVKEEMARFKQRYGIGLPLMPVHREGVRTMIESGANMRDLLKADIPTNYKIPTYGTQKAGDFGKSMVLDVHEAAGQTQGSRFHPYFTEQGGFGPTEYGLAEGKMLDIAKEMGIPGGMAQAGRWFGGGELTGLKSPRGDALDLLEKQTAYTLQGQGINPTPKVVRDYILNMVESGEGVLMPYFKSKPMPDYRTQKAEGGAVSKEEDNDPSMALIAEILLDMAKKQGKKEAKSLGQPRATTDLLNRGVVAPLAGMPVDLVNMGLEGVDAIRSLFGPVNTKLASEKPFLGSEYLKDLMNKYNMTSGEERPMMETGLSIFSPGAAIRSAAGAAESLPRAARAAESGINQATAAATRPFVPATVTMEAVAPDLAKFKPRQWQETATRRLTGPGAPVSMDVMGGQRTTKRPGQGVYENFAGDLETNPLVAIDVPRAGNLSTNTPLRRDIVQAGSDLAQESVAAHRFVPMMTNQIKDASAMLIKPKGGSLSNEQVIEMAKSLPGMIVAHNPRLGGVVVMPFDYQPGKIPPEFRDANQVARKVLGDKAAVTYGKADPVKDRLYIERGEYAGEGIGLPSAETTKMRQRLQRAEQRLFAPRQSAAVSPP
jgi:hypothetical protein